MEVKVDEEKVENTQVEAPVEENVRTLNEEDIISYLKEKHNKEVASVDELFDKREKEPLLLFPLD